MDTYTFTLRVDPHRNVMYIRQTGRPTAAGFSELKREFAAALDQLQPGFSIINDQREMLPYDDDAMVVGKELVEMTNEARAARVIRIVPVDFLSIVALSKTLEAGRSRYASIRVATPEEAEDALDALTDQDTAL
jgi:hypothetical protein